MSFENKISLASGDGAKNVLQKGPIKLRKPATPSSRRFGARSNSTNRTELQKAIEQISSPVRRKSLTVAEITPTRNRNHKKENTTDSICFRSVTPRKNKQLAGRRIYESLLLYSWRKRKADIGFLTESLRALETQNRKLELQIDALHQLRIAESEKRNEAVTQTQLLSRENEETIQKNKNLQNEKQLLQNEVQVFREKLTKIHVQFENTKNDLIARHAELENSEHQLGLERTKNKRLRAEKKSFKEHEAIRKREIQDYRDQLEDLNDRLLKSEVNLQDSIILNDSYKKENKELSEKLEVEISANKRMREDNEKLKFCLFAIRKVLKKEKNRSLWRNAGDLGFAFLSSMKSLAVTLLPLMPYEDSA